MPWCCARTKPHCEQVVRDNLERQGMPTFLPAFLIKKPDRHIAVKLLFRSYIFMYLDNPASWPRVRNTIGVTNLITYAPDEEEYLSPSLVGHPAIMALRQQALEKDEIRRGTGRKNTITVDHIKPGCYVKVISGPFQNKPWAQKALVHLVEHESAELLAFMFNRECKVKFYLKELELIQS